MTQIEIANLEHASRTAFGWAPAGQGRRTHYLALFTALVPAAGILAVAATMLLAIV